MTRWCVRKMESAYCQVPEGLHEAGQVCTSLLHEMTASVPFDASLRAELELLRKKHAATLFSALDYHALGDLDEHHLQARKTHALIRACARELVDLGISPAAIDRLCESLARCSQLCSISPSEPPVLPTVQSWSRALRKYLRQP